MPKQSEMPLNDPLSPEAEEKKKHKAIVRDALAVMDLYPEWGCDDPQVVKEHHRIALSIVIQRIKNGAPVTTLMKEVRQYRTLIKEKGWSRKRIMSPLTFFNPKSLRRRIALGQRYEDPVTKFARDSRMPVDLAEEFHEQS